MLYQKPKDVKYTDMCIYIDNNIYREDLTEDEINLIYQYIYHICYMLARKSKFFNRSALYDDFAIHDATRIFMRYRNPKQDILKEDGSPKLDRIKSILNYAKATLYGAKVEFEQLNYCQTLSYDDVENSTYDMSYSFSNQLSDSVDELTSIDFEHSLGTIGNIIDSFIDKLPYRRDSKRLSNIKISCILTLINQITLTKPDQERFDKFNAKPYDHSFILETIYNKNRQDCVVLYHLEDSMSNYIAILVEELKHVIAKELSEALHTYIPANNSAYILAELNGTAYRFEE